jgi:hypothetical protein
MDEADARTYVVRVTRHDEQLPSGRRTMFYAVISDSSAEALAVVRTTVEPDAYVEVTDGKLLPETARVLGLSHGVAKAM